MSAPRQKRREDLAELRDVAVRPSVEHAVAAVRDFLGLDVAYATEFVDGKQVFRVLRGDGDSFGVHQGLEMPLEETYCRRILDGRLPNVIGDVRGDERASSLPVTEAADVGAFVSVPIRFSGGRFYGTMCAASHEAKPELGDRELQFLHVFARIIADQIERDELQDAVRGAEQQATAASALIAALHARDGYTGEHSEAVVSLAAAIAKRLGLGESEIAEIRLVALLHDVGKIAVPDAILSKPGRLTAEETQLMRAHPVDSERIVANAPGLEHLGPLLRAEHERWDGTGYPDGLAGDQIPLASRITFVCDAYHAMISDRPYRLALTLDDARRQITAGAGSQFCPTSARALLDELDAATQP